MGGRGKRDARRRIVVELPEEALDGLERLSATLKVRPEDVLASAGSVFADYSEDLSRWGLELKVRREHRLDSLMEEVVYYAVTSYRNVVSRLLDRLKAKGRFELEHFEIIPEDSTLVVELVALEGSDIAADRVRIVWSPEGVLVEAYYYLEEDLEPPLRRNPEGFSWDYLPDEHAIVVAVQAKSMREVPPLYRFDQASGVA
ncbi:MAG: hypothetical protein LRS48_06875 [Desulfurococcales archaeon]|nr:hypothetical protein [Desulfurococcales archaeon]